MERCITQLEEGEKKKAREKMGCVNCISTNTRHTCRVAKALNDRLVQRRGEMQAEEDKEKEEMGTESFWRERERERLYCKHIPLIKSFLCVIES